MRVVDAITVELELRPARNPDGVVHVEGTARAENGSAEPFSGWMALLQLLETLVEQDR
jgi:hypothetical protein